MAVYVIAVFLCSVDDGSSQGNDDVHLSLSTVLHLFTTILGDFIHLHPNQRVYLQILAKDKGLDMKRYLL